MKDWDIEKITDWESMRVRLWSETKITLITWLNNQGYYGFVCEPNESGRGECECDITNLVPCGLVVPDCKPARKVVCELGTTMCADCREEGYHLEVDNE